jgi:hypothetical protein
MEICPGPFLIAFDLSETCLDLSLTSACDMVRYNSN